jgi:hypothetical protein
MIFALEALEAQFGDCLLLHSGTPADPRFILIDGGPPGVFKATLNPRLKELQALRPGEPLPIDLLMISHIDGDHIRGILDLTRELIDEQDRGVAFSRDVQVLWHNSFDDIVGGTHDGAVASLAGRLSAALARPGTPLDVPVQPRSAQVLASVMEGRTLRGRAEKLGWTVNTPFGSLVTRPVVGPRRVDFPGGVTLTVLGPSAKRVEDLQKEWDEELRKHHVAVPATAEGGIAALVDKSVANLSSIIVLAEGGGKRMLLTGDARGDDILEGLRAAGLLQQGKVHVNVLKLPHHGSIRNVDASFFATVTADHYVVSANGKDGNPDVETLKLIADARGSDEYAFCLTNRRGLEKLESKLRHFFDADRIHNRRYEVRFRADDARSISVNLGSDAHP